MILSQYKFEYKYMKKLIEIEKIYKGKGGKGILNKKTNNKKEIISITS